MLKSDIDGNNKKIYDVDKEIKKLKNLYVKESKKTEIISICL